MVGARRVRQGLGPFVARYLSAAGAEIAGVLGTSPDSVGRACRDLEGMLPARPRGYTDLAPLLEREKPDALAILSPHPTHEGYLEAALAAGLHTLCEKPLIWGGEGLGGRAAAICARFERAGLLLRESCQWPLVLDSYRRLFPETSAGPPEEVGMELCPVALEPVGMLADSLSHPLSLLQAVLPDPEAEVHEIRSLFVPGGEPDPGASPAGPRLEVRFRYGARPSIEATVRLTPSDALPRPAALALDGRWARREVREPGYQIHLTAGGRSEMVPDPLGALVGRFVSDLHSVLSGRRPEGSGDIAQRMRLFERVLGAVKADLAGRPGSGSRSGAGSSAEAGPGSEAGRRASAGRSE